MKNKIQYITEIDNIIKKTMLFENFSNLSLNKQTLLVEQLYMDNKLNEQWYNDAYDAVADVVTDASDAVGDVWNESQDEFHNAMAWVQGGLAVTALGAYATGVGAPVGVVASWADGIIDLGYAVGHGINGDYGAMSWRLGGVAFSAFGLNSIKGAASTVKAVDATVDIVKASKKIHSVYNVTDLAYTASSTAAKIVTTTSTTQKVINSTKKLTSVVSDLVAPIVKKAAIKTAPYVNKAYVANQIAKFPGPGGLINNFIGTNPEADGTWVNKTQKENPTTFFDYSPSSIRNMYLEPADGNLKQNIIKSSDNFNAADAPENVPGPVDNSNYNDSIQNANNIQQKQNYVDSLTNLYNKPKINTTQNLKNGTKIVNGIPVNDGYILPPFGRPLLK